MMEAARTSETSVDNYFTRQYIPEDNSEHHTRRRENLKSHILYTLLIYKPLYFNYNAISEILSIIIYHHYNYFSQGVFSRNIF
jgi:hypothetical protein